MVKYIITVVFMCLSAHSFSQGIDIDYITRYGSTTKVKHHVPVTGVEDTLNTIGNLRDTSLKLRSIMLNNIDSVYTFNDSTLRAHQMDGTTMDVVIRGNGGAGATNYWQRSGGVISPVTSTDNLSITGTLTTGNIIAAVSGTTSIGSSSNVFATGFINNIGSSGTGTGFGLRQGTTERMRLAPTTGNVLINTTTDVASSRFTVASTTQGSIPVPAMTTTQRNAISSPATGLQVYNTTTNTRDFYNGTAWVNNNIGYTTVTTSTYTVPDVSGNEFIVFVNYGAGTATITMPSPSTNAGKKVTIKSITANGVSISGTIFSSDPNTIGASSYTAITYTSDGTTFYKTN